MVVVAEDIVDISADTVGGGIVTTAKDDEYSVRGLLAGLLGNLQV